VLEGNSCDPAEKHDAHSCIYRYFQQGNKTNEPSSSNHSSNLCALVATTSFPKQMTSCTWHCLPCRAAVLRGTAACSGCLGERGETRRCAGHGAKQSDRAACRTGRNFSPVFLRCQIPPRGGGGWQAPRPSPCPAGSLSLDHRAQRGEGSKPRGAAAKPPSRATVPAVRVWGRCGGRAAPASLLVPPGRALPSAGQRLLCLAVGKWPLSRFCLRRADGRHGRWERGFL